MTTTRRLAPRGLLLALITLAVPACGDGREGFHFAVHPAAGRVVRDGRPVAGAFVRFHPTDPATLKMPAGQEGPPVMLTAETDADGRFAMSTYLADDGVPAGEYAVTVAAGTAGSDVENADSRRGAAARGPASGPDPIYRDPARTPLKVAVKPGDNHFDFELD